MDWQNILWTILSIVGTAIISWLAERLISFLNDKISDSKIAKLLTSVVNVITNAVKNTYQTFVEELKYNGEFTKEKQEEALNKAKEMIMTQLTNEGKEYIQSTFGDIDAWVTSKIEATIYDLKNLGSENKQITSKLKYK